MPRPSTFVQIDPSRALCWESGDVLRVGFDRILAQVKVPSTTGQHLVGALIAGMSEDELQEPALTRRHGTQGAKILASLKPALITRARRPEVTASELPLPTASTQATPQSAIRVRMSDDGHEVSGLREILEADWLCRFDTGNSPPELAIQVLRFLEPLERTRRWLGEGVPHLLIRFTDDSVRIGPLVSGDGGPCHCCEVLSLVENDPALPSLAAQLYGERPVTERPSVSWLVGAVAAQYVRSWRLGKRHVHNTQVVLVVEEGLVSGLPQTITIRPHPQCGCMLNE